MQKIIISCFCCLFIFFGCSNPKDKSVVSKNINTNEFVLEGQLNGYLSNKVYLNKIFDNILHPIDSTLIKNNQFTFRGIVEYPERFALTFENYSSTIVFIVENTPFQIKINTNNIEEAVITGSPLNDLLNEYKLNSKRIFSKIELLFPKFQKARLENDVETLAEIGKQINIIEKEFKNYSYDFINNNTDSYVSAMILSDQLKSSNIDTLKIKETYNLLSDKVKNSPDAQIISFNIN